MSASKQHNFATLMARLSRAGFKGEFAKSAILPDWWDDECERDPSVLPEVELRVARFLGEPLSRIQDPQVALAPTPRPTTQLRRVRDVDRERIEPAIHAAIAIAGAVVRNLRNPVPAGIPPEDPLAWHHQLKAKAPTVTLKGVCSDLWARGIPVVPIALLPAPKFQGAACIVGDRPVGLIGHRNDEPARVAFWVAHEAGHIAAGDCAPDGPVIDEADIPDRSEVERRADRYARIALLGDADIPEFRGDDVLQLARKASEFQRATGAEASAALFTWAARTGKHKEAALAVKALYAAIGGRRTLIELFEQHVDRDGASETDRALLGCVDSEPKPLAAAG